MSDGENAIFKIMPDTHVVAVWYVPMRGSDWLALAFRNADKIPRVTYRFRYYRDDKHWDSDDHKSVYSLEGPPDGTDEELLDLGDQIYTKILALLIAEEGPEAADKAERKLVNGGSDALMDVLSEIRGIEMRTSLDSEPS